MRLRRNIMIAMVTLALGIGMGAQAHTYASSMAAQSRVVAHKLIQAKDVGSSFGFAPTTIRIKVGTMVTWKNTTSAPHTVTSTTKSWTFNKPLNQGKSVNFIFRKAGTYKYYCTYHPWMVGKIIVHM